MQGVSKRTGNVGKKAIEIGAWLNSYAKWVTRDLILALKGPEAIAGGETPRTKKLHVM